MRGLTPPLLVAVALFSSSFKAFAQMSPGPLPTLPTCAAGCLEYELPERTKYNEDDENCPFTRYGNSDRRVTYKCVRTACGDKYYWTTVITGLHECGDAGENDNPCPTGATCAP